MPYRYTGAPAVPAALFHNTALRTTSENDIVYSAGDYITRQITRQFPISRIRCFLRGTIAKTTTGGTLNDFGALNLIDNLSVSLNGNEPIFTAKGRHLHYIHWMYHGVDPYTVNPDFTNGNDFDLAFDIPFDVGGYLTLLDASGIGSLDVAVQFGTNSDMFTGGSYTLSNVRLELKEMVVTGIADGLLGGKKYGYAREYLATTTQPVTQTQSDFHFDLIADRSYHGLTLIAEAASSYDDTIINSVILERGGNRVQSWDTEQIKAVNSDRYRLSLGDWVGVYDVPFVDPNCIGDALSIDNSQSMRLILDVTKPSGSASVVLIQQYILRALS